jgi:hypothetical protein
MRDICLLTLVAILINTFLKDTVFGCTRAMRPIGRVSKLRRVKAKTGNARHDGP